MASVPLTDQGKEARGAPRPAWTRPVAVLLGTLIFVILFAETASREVDPALRGGWVWVPVVNIGGGTCCAGSWVQ